MKNLYYSIAAILAMFALSASADVTLPSKCEAFQPSAFLSHTITEATAKKIETSSTHGQEGKTTSKFWVVYSDRANNATYTTPSTYGTQCDKLDFNEKVRIAKISGDFALVYSEPQEGIQYPKISAGAKAKGWIPLSNLLLWRTCPTNEKGIYYKALIVANLDKTHKGDNDLGRLYYSPSKTGKSENLQSDMNFYFIMKRSSNGLVLLARQYKMDGATEYVMHGWVSESSIIPWNQRSCLEPNWNPDDVEYFKTQGTKAIVYSDKGMSVKSADIAYGRKNSEDNNPYSTYRMNNKAMRFPILDNDTQNDQVYKCTTFGTVGGSLSEAQNYQEQINKARENVASGLQNVNLIVVIDGTTSMEKYFPAVKHAIKEGFNYFRDNYKVRVGLVIYRDYPDGAGLVEYTPLTSPTDARLLSMLDTGGKYGIKSHPSDHTHTEALFKGLETALDMSKMGYKADQGNLILVVGDCGNALDDQRCLSEEQILSKLVKNNVQLMSFQVRRQNSQPWLLFNSQMNGFIKDNLERKYKSLGDVKLKFNQIADGYDLKTDTKHQFYIGSTRFARIGEDMEPGRLSALIRSSVQLFAGATSDQIDVIFNPNVTDNPDRESRIDQEFLRSKVGDRIFDLIKKSNTMVSFSGYTKKKDPSDRDYWKPIIYISTDELSTLISQLQGVNTAAQQGDRKPYVDAMKALVRSMLPDISSSEMDAMGVQEVMNLITGLNASTQALKGPSLVQVQDPKAVSNAEFNGLVTRFTQKYNNLKKIKNDKNYKYSLMINNTKYYWIPIEDLP